jgi:hypothetical protein
LKHIQGHLGQIWRVNIINFMEVDNT